MEWTDSPIGPYNEVAVLSALVYNGGRLGAWASHIVVTTPDAVQAGREVFGLPAQLGSVTLGDGGGTDMELESSDAVRLGCWDGWNDPPPSVDVSRLQWPPLRFSLPSFSGCLPTEKDGTGPLLFYPLTLGPARRVRLRPALRVRGAPGLPKELGDLFTYASPASPCLQVDGVDIVAGQPTEVRSDASTSPGPDLPLRLWRAAKTAPSWCTGARGKDGDDAPLAALFNLMLIRLPFIAGCTALLINTLLGGGVAMGDLSWPPATSSGFTMP